MRVQRGDIVTADYPNSSGVGSKVRPVLVVQDNYYNARITNVLVANITSNLKNANDRSHYLIDLSTPDGPASGLLRNSVVSCINLATLRVDRIQRRVGALSDQAMRQIDECLKAALGLP